MPRMLPQVPTAMDDVPDTIVGNVLTERIPRRRRKKEASRDTAPVVTAGLGFATSDASDDRFIEILIQRRKLQRLQRQREIDDIQRSVNQRLDVIRRKH